MCEHVPCKPPENAHPKWRRLSRFGRALRFPLRWAIIECIGEGARSTGEIYAHLVSSGETISKSGLYYHLSELKNAGIIEVARYVEEGGGAPEKVWRLRTRRIAIDLLGPDPEEGE